MEEAKLFYSQFKLTLKFPQYLPDDYRYKCSVFETSDEIISFYDNGDIFLNPPRSEMDKIDYFKNGGLYFEYDRSTPKDYYLQLSSIKHRTITHPDFNYSEINGKLVTTSGGMYFGTNIYINSIAVYTKDSFSVLAGNLTMVELKKIAESIRLQ